MLSLIIWMVFGLVVGVIAKLIHPGDEPVGFFATIAIGVAGSFIGGGINWLIGKGNYLFSSSGLFMSVIGGVIFCALWRWYTLKMSTSGPPKSFFTGKRIK